LRVIEICRDTTNCSEEICLLEGGLIEPNYGFGFKSIATIFNCLFLPLSNEPIKVIYDTRSNEIMIE
jgi:hypothetical protein